MDKGLSTGNHWLQQVFPPEGGTAIVDIFPTYREDIEKARSLPVGSTTTRKDGEYKKVSAGKWKKVTGGKNTGASLYTKANAAASRIVRETKGKYEKSVAFDDSGNVLLEKSGEVSTIRFNKAEQSMLHGGRLFVHNHPGALSFSPQDVLFAYGNGLSEIWAVTETVRYKYRPDFQAAARKAGGADARNPEEAKAVAKSLIDTVQEADSSVRSELWGAIFSSGNDSDVVSWAEKNHSHRVMLEVVANLGGVYTVEKRKGNRWVPHTGKDVYPLEKSSTYSMVIKKSSELVEHLKKKGTYRKGSALRVDPKQLAMGVAVEMEHSDNREVAREIALDHLAEDPEYYTHLREMENKYAKSIGGRTMENSKLALVVIPGELSKAHPAKLSKPNTKTKSGIPYEGHTERMKLAQMAAQRMLGANAPESEKEHTNTSVVSHDGRVAGGKAPYSSYATGVSGSGSQAHDLYGKETYTVKPSEIGSSTPEKTLAHTPVKSVRGSKR